MFDSVRIRLTVWYVGVLALLLIAFSAVTYFLVVRVLSKETDENLESMTRNFQAAVEAEKADDEAPHSAAEDIRGAINELHFRDYNFAVYDEQSRLVTATFADDNLNAALLESSDPAPNFATIKTKKDKFRIRTVPLKYGAEEYRLFVTYSLHDQTRFLNRLQTIYFVAVPIALVLTGLGGYFLARKSLAPVVDMSRRASTIGATNLHERLPVKNEKDELGNLAQIFNALLLRLENSFEQQRRFMADASHELRTPLAIVRGESEVALAKENRPPDELRESLAIVHDESKRLSKIVEDLLTLARADAGQFKVNFKPIYLEELLADCTRAVQILAKKRNVKFELSTLEEMPLSGDETLLRRLFLNLFDNAIKYNHEEGKVSVSAENSASAYRILIANTGSKISAEEQEKIFERFYRADKARSRTEETVTSGSGLGLSIARWIAELHHGTIKVISSNEDGTVFAVILPAENKILDR